jgi:pimeloyl-ACP methyl ester carboxylesterase
MSVDVIAVNDTGVREADALFLHGYACSAEDWTAVADRLPGTHLLVDLPGHGTQSTAPSAGFGELVDDTAALLARLSRPAVLIGHSMGGMVAMRVAATHPGLIRGLVLADAFPSLPVVVEVFGGAEDPDDPFGYGSVIDRETPADVQSRVRASMSAGIRTAGAHLHAELMALDLRAELAAVTCPVLVLIGDRHRRPAPDPDELADLLGFGALTTRFVELVPSHHFVMLERPDMVARHIEEFLLDQEATSKGKK